VRQNPRDPDEIRKRVAAVKRRQKYAGRDGKPAGGPGVALENTMQILRRGLLMLVFLPLSSGAAESLIPPCKSAADKDALRADILQHRPLPLTGLNVCVSLNVKDSGAVPGDGKDDRAAVAAAVLPLTGKKDLLIDGHGAEIRIHRQDISFAAITNSTNLIIRNFSIDYDPLPFSQGTVRSVNLSSGSFTFELQSGFPVPDNPFFKSCDSFGMLKDAARPGRLKADTSSFFACKEISPAGDGLFCAVLPDSRKIAKVKSGDVLVLVGRSASIGRYFNSENITLDHLTAYACPGSLFVGSQTAQLDVLNCKAVLKGCRPAVNGADLRTGGRCSV